MAMHATISVILYKSKTLKNGEHPLMLRATVNGKRKYISMGISCPKKFWNEKMQLPRKNHPDYSELKKIIKNKLGEYEKQELRFNEEEKEFTASSIVESVEHTIKNKSVFEFFDFEIANLKMSNKVGNAQVYQDTFNSIKTATKNSDFSFSQMDIPFLNKYERFLRSRDLTDNTMSVRFRTLRSLFNKAIEEKVVKEQYYPFKKYKISKFSKETVRRAITRDEIKKLENLDLSKRMYHAEARNLFLFSYYGAGINFSDIAKLTPHDITNNRITYKRAKTGKIIQFGLLPPAKKILEDFMYDSSLKNSKYIFPILDKNIHKTATQIDNRIHKVITRTNKYLKELGREIDLQIPLTTYVARHSFATSLKNAGVHTAIISESMGHQNEAITETYLKSFENDVMDEAMKKLL